MQAPTNMITFTGKRVDPLNLSPDDLDIEDIAHALSNTCRFGGHCRDFYSVAQHCIYVSNLVPADLALEGLLHDASEAYIVDIITPIKHRLTGYHEIEDRIMQAVGNKYGFRWPVCPIVHIADQRLAITELLALFDIQPSTLQSNYQPFTWFAFNPIPPKQAKQEFLDRFHEIYDK